MTGYIEVPVALFILLIVFAAVATLDRLLVPSVRWFVRRRVNRVLEEVSEHLQLKIEPFKLTKREVLIDRLMYDKEVIEAAEAHAVEQNMPREVVMAKIERYAREIVPAFNAYFYFRIGTWLARKVARLLYRVRLGSVDNENLSSIDPKSTVVFVMNHRSNMDYVLVGYLAASQTALSYAVGEWARVWPLQALIRSMGAYFVRRRSRKPLYRCVLSRYIHMATEGGVTQAMFPEGGLTRDGLLREPKKGLLDYMLRSFDPDGERDLVFVPVGLNYDRVLEDRTLLLDLEPQGNRPSTAQAVGTTFRFVARNMSQMLLGRWHRFGYVCVNFGAPISMREHWKKKRLRPDQLSEEERFVEVGVIAEELMSEVGAVIPVVPVSVVARVFENDGKGMTEFELKAASQQVLHELESRGVPIYIPREDREYAILVGLRMLTLRHVVVERGGLLSPVPEEKELLDYYANSIAHHFE
ncbi:MAG: glycerol-3-phosphate acyltransferase [bacterium]|nr:glycerol-3-phosphate acyltransferase [bacterium]